MNINLHFSHVEVPDYLRINIEGHITEMFGELGSKSNLVIELFCKKEYTAKNHSDKFKVHITAEAPWLRKQVYVQCLGDECWETIVDASSKLKRKVFSNKKSNIRRRGKADWATEEITEEVREEMTAM